MEDQHTHNQPSKYRIPLGVVISVSVVLIAGSATAWWTWNTLNTQNAANDIGKNAPNSPAAVAPETSADGVPPKPTVPGTNQQTQPEPRPVVSEQTVQIYYLKDIGTGLELVPTPVTVEAANQPAAILKAAFNELIKGPRNPEAASTIPKTTRLLSLEVREDGVHVDLSREFTTGGGSASMVGRLGQVLYTATSLDPDIPVWVSVEGKSLDVLGGEGILVKQPMTRSNFDENFQM